MIVALPLVLFTASSRGIAQVLTYEGANIPEADGWVRLPENDPHGERTVKAGWLIQTVGLPEGWPGPIGDGDFYRKDLTDFTGTARFFVEWRAITDNPSWLIDQWQTPAAVAAGGNAASLYHTVMTDSAAVLLRDITIPRIVTPVSADLAHVYRVEVFPDAYMWYVDGVLTDSGTPEGAYPDANARLTWGVRRSYVDATTAWDYVRVGVIPDDASGDYNTDGFVEGWDYYFVHDCLTKDGPGIYGGPGRDAARGCAFVDYDGNRSVDLFDFAEFANHFTGSLP